MSERLNIDVPEDLLAAAASRAAEDGTSLDELVTQAIRRELQARMASSGRTPEVPTLPTESLPDLIRRIQEEEDIEYMRKWG